MQQVEHEINRIVRVLYKDQSVDGSWKHPFETGIVTDCYMIILLRVLEWQDEPLIQSLAHRIIKKQERNGSWKLFPDESGGNVSATAEAYSALLYSGYRTKNDPDIQAAKRFILSKGGLDKTSTFTKTMFAITGQYPWSELFQLPVEIILLPVSFPVHFFDLAVFTRANLAPVLILSDAQYSVKTNGTPDLSDLHQSRDSGVHFLDSAQRQSITDLIEQGIQTLAGLPEGAHSKALQEAEQYMIQRIEPDGTLESYFSSTLLMIFALMSRGYSKRHPIILKAVQGILSMICRIDGNAHVQYTTATVWNTALISSALQKAGIAHSSPVIRKANHYILSRQHIKYGDWAIRNPVSQPGGWGFSNINTINPDVDDTAYALRAIQFAARENQPFRHAWDRGVKWLISMQNDDGGWPSFERNVDKEFITWLPIEGAEDLLIDPSTPDLTGRTLNFFGSSTVLDKQYPMIRRGIEWLINHQEKNGSWQGRWGICYIYGTWAAVTGLIATGLEPEHPAIRKAVKWLTGIQNSDGGWGESCKSDIEKRYVPLKISTRAQTAWALDALIAASPSITPEMEHGIEFLVNERAQPDGAESYPTGRGMAGAFYMHYHSYTWIWPLIALSHFRTKFAGS
ncbi:squalene--hopene cyclase [Sporolactobacillus sp. THM7-4]|nr:squalene--hopene cyclase [Sporolactobacillus sp. THM7-4]